MAGWCNTARDKAELLLLENNQLKLIIFLEHLMKYFIHIIPQPYATSYFIKFYSHSMLCNIWSVQEVSYCYH